MKKYLEHIVSNSKYQVWLHRTSQDVVDRILKEGLYFGTDLSTTATLQSPKIERAEGSYMMTHKGSDAVIVIKIPQEIASKYYLLTENSKGPRHQAYEFDKEVSYWHTEKKGIAIQRKHVHGWIDRKTHEYYENPYLNESQELSSENFPRLYYGDLEKEVMKKEIKPGKKFSKNIKKGKKLKPLELPPPPEEIFLPA